MANYGVLFRYNCTEMVKSCMYAGLALNNCCIFSEAIMTDIGKCFKFKNFGNHSWLNRQMISGAFYGLHMLVDVNQDEYAGISSVRLYVTRKENCCPYQSVA